MAGEDIFAREGEEEEDVFLGAAAFMCPLPYVFDEDSGDAGGWRLDTANDAEEDDCARRST